MPEPIFTDGLMFVRGIVTIIRIPGFGSLIRVLAAPAMHWTDFYLPVPRIGAGLFYSVAH
jgi:hypothetical protein